MDFEFSEDEKQFIRDVREFLRENHDPDVMDLHRENLAQLSDTPARRAFMQKLARRGWLGITWPKEYGGQDGNGFYEYLLNELLSGVGAPQLGKGTGVVGKTLIRVASDKLKREFLPKILAAEVEFALGYTEPSAGSDAAAMRLKAERSGEGWLLMFEEFDILHIIDEGTDRDALLQLVRERVNEVVDNDRIFSLEVSHGLDVQVANLDAVVSVQKGTEDFLLGVENLDHFFHVVP